MLSMGSIADHKSAVLSGTGSLADRELAYWATLESTGTGVGNAVIALGDSITSMGSAAGLRSNDEYFAWASLLSDSKIGYLRNAGLGGDVAAGALARLKTDVLDYKPDWCFIHIGVNDAYINLTSLASYQASIRALVQNCVNAGVRPILSTVQGRSDLASNLVDQYNTFLRTYSLGSGVPLVDFNKATLDPTTGLMKASYAADGLHPNELGAKMLGEAMAAGLAPPIMYPWEPPLAVHQAASNPNLVGNALLLTDSNADGLADGWTIAAGTPTCIIVPGDSSLLGNWQRMSQATNNVQQSLYYYLGAPGATYSVGDRLGIAFRVAWVIGAGGGAANIALVEYNSGQQYQPVWNMKAVPIGNKVVYGEVTLRSDTVNLYLYMSLMAGTGGSGWLQIAQPTVINYTRLGLNGLLPGK